MAKLEWLITGFALGALLAVAPSCGGGSSAADCNASSCRDGCCDGDGVCRTMGNSTCGQYGSQCHACGLGQTCMLGACQGGTNTGGGSGTGGSGTGGSGTGGSGTGGSGTGGSGTGGSGTGGSGTGGSGTGGSGTGGSGTGGSGTGGGSSSCTGCYMGSTCIEAPYNELNSACGTGGAACQQCTNQQACVNYQCTGSGTGGGAGGGGGTTCTSGCTLSSGSCAPGNTTSACGAYGDACMTCGSGQTCTNGVCTTTTGGGAGAACTSSAQCASGFTCRTTTSRGDGSYPGGYCTKTCTEGTTNCGSTATCMDLSATFISFYGESASMCLSSCGSNNDCRSGYGCYGASSGSGVCWLNPAPPFNGGGQATRTGSACTSEASCANPPDPTFAICLDEAQNGFPGGYCSADCSFDNTGTFCGASATCATINRATGDPLSMCLKTCTSVGTQSNCRAGYVCGYLGSSSSPVCWPGCVTTGCSTGTCNTATGFCE